MDIPIYDGLRAAMARVSKDFRNLPYGMHIMAGARSHSDTDINTDTNAKLYPGRSISMAFG